MVKQLIAIYQSTRFMRPSCCRFYPSCSDYCLQAVETHGLIKGLGLTLKRLAKCHPWHAGGVDLIPSEGLTPSLVGVDVIDPPIRRTRADAISPYGLFADSQNVSAQQKTMVI